MNKNLRLVLNILIVIVSILYPFVLFFYKQRLGIGAISILMILVFGLRAILNFKGISLVLSIAMIIFFAIIGFLDFGGAMYWYPIIVSLIMLFFFSTSLLGKQSIIERIARIRHPDLPPEGIKYTRRVTQIWCLFFIINIIITVFLILIKEWNYWTLYTGFISYILMGLLFIGEWLYRYFILKIKL